MEYATGTSQSWVRSISKESALITPAVWEEVLLWGGVLFCMHRMTHNSSSAMGFVREYSTVVELDWISDKELWVLNGQEQIRTLAQPLNM